MALALDHSTLALWGPWLVGGRGGEGCLLGSIQIPGAWRVQPLPPHFLPQGLCVPWPCLLLPQGHPTP